MASKHTPGPWRFEWDGDEAVIIGRPAWPCNRHGVQGEWQVAVTDDLLCEKPEEAEANARLIAAAPALYEALKAEAEADEADAAAEEYTQRADAEGWLDDPTGSLHVNEAWDRSRELRAKAKRLRSAAIAKAEAA